MISPWIVRHAHRPLASTRLICFPHAGGAAWAYGRWAAQLPESIDVVAVELPGHGSRISEPPWCDFETLMRHLVDVLLPELDSPFALFGHSLGAILAFEFARRLPNRLDHHLSRLFVSGHNAPQLDDDLEDVSQLDDRQLIDRLRTLNCTPAEALNNQELMDLMLPVIRADFSLYNSYAYQGTETLDVPIVAFWGLRDPRTNLPGILAWQSLTRCPFSLRQFAGDHFFVSSQEDAVLEIIAAELNLVG